MFLFFNLFWTKNNFLKDKEQKFRSQISKTIDSQTIPGCNNTTKHVHLINCISFVRYVKNYSLLGQGQWVSLVRARVAAFNGDPASLAHDNIVACQAHPAVPALVVCDKL